METKYINTYGKIQSLEGSRKSHKVLRSNYEFFCFFFNWDSPHARLNSHYEAWNYKKRNTKKITGYRKSL